VNRGPQGFPASPRPDDPSAADPWTLSAPIRIVLGNPGLDGHDRGIKVVARALRDAGMEVIYLPLRTTVEQFVRIAVQEDADVVGISNLSATITDTCARVRRLLVEAGAGDVLVVAGGAVSPRDREALAGLGIRHVFGPGSDTRQIAEQIREAVNRQRVESLANPGTT
jgi:methylmalonyl-CoA mutase C-terminal domain/subunit